MIQLKDFFFLWNTILQDVFNMTDDEFEEYVEDCGGETYRDECIHEHCLSAVLVNIKMMGVILNKE